MVLRSHFSCRRGEAVTEWFVIFGFVVVATFFFLGWSGDSLKGNFSGTAERVGDPAQLSNYWRNRSNASQGSISQYDESSSSDGGSSSRPLGNNGLGNGIDAPPPGNPPENDGEGTSPGDPGNKGGALK